MANLAPRVQVEWRGDRLRFQGRAGDRPWVEVDGDAGTAISPVETLLLAAATCAASDVVVILKKMRVALTSVTVDVEGRRREQEPRRYTAIRFAWRLGGEGLVRDKAQRAVDLSIQKYCSVLASLAPDIGISSDIVVE
ncbi:MAG: OsmC family protein [Gemmatimonadales bacterium]